jgi:ABC-type phosphate transport system permease subunit
VVSTEKSTCSGGSASEAGWWRSGAIAHPRSRVAGIDPALIKPSVRWAVVYGLILTTARALGEFGAVAVVSGNIAGQTQTLPLFIEDAYKQYDTELAYGAALILGGVASERRRASRSTEGC